MAMVWRRVGLLEVDYTIFVISEGGRIWPDANDGTDHLMADEYPVENGFIVHDNLSTIVRTGFHTGPVELTIELHDTRPEAQLDPWQEVAEFTAHSEFGDLRVAAFDDFPEWSLISTGGRGAYGLRVHAAGRDSALDGSRDRSIEQYLVVAWREPSIVDGVTILKTTDRTGAEYRKVDSS